MSRFGSAEGCSDISDDEGNPANEEPARIDRLPFYEYCFLVISSYTYGLIALHQLKSQILRIERDRMPVGQS
jgi:hypothetical protein